MRNFHNLHKSLEFELVVLRISHLILEMHLSEMQEKKIFSSTVMFKWLGVKLLAVSFCLRSVSYSMYRAYCTKGVGYYPEKKK